MIGLFAAAIIGIAQLAALMPQYADQFQAQLDGLKSWLSSMGVTQADVQKAVSGIDKSSILSAAGALLDSIKGIFSSVFFLIVLVIFMGVDGSVFGDRMISRRPGREPVLTALGTFAAGTRKYFAVATIFGGIVAILDGAALVILGIPAAGLWALLAFVTNYVPNIGFLIGLVPPALLALLTGGPSLMITVIVVYCVLNFIIQSVLQPKFVGDAVGLTTTVSFLSLIVWAYLLGPIGAILAIPASLLFKALLVDVDPDAKWLQLFLGDEPVFKVKDPNRPKRFGKKKPADTAAITAAAGGTPPDPRGVQNEHQGRSTMAWTGPDVVGHCIVRGVTERCSWWPTSPRSSPHLPRVLLLADHPVEQPGRARHLRHQIAAFRRSRVLEHRPQHPSHPVQRDPARSPQSESQPLGGAEMRVDAGRTNCSVASRWAATATASSARMSTSTARRSASAACSHSGSRPSSSPIKSACARWQSRSRCRTALSSGARSPSRGHSSSLSAV